MIFRMFSTLLVSVTVGRWIYAEINLVMPGAIPAVNYLLEATSLPTHDKWPKDSMDQLVNAVSTAVGGERDSTFNKGTNEEIAAAILPKAAKTSDFQVMNTQVKTPSWREDLASISAMLSSTRS